MRTRTEPQTKHRMILRKRPTQSDPSKKKPKHPKQTTNKLRRGKTKSAYIGRTRRRCRTITSTVTETTDQTETIDQLIIDLIESRELTPLPEDEDGEDDLTEHSQLPVNDDMDDTGTVIAGSTMEVDESLASATLQDAAMADTIERTKQWCSGLPLSRFNSWQSMASAESVAGSDVSIPDYGDTPPSSQETIAEDDDMSIVTRTSRGTVRTVSMASVDTMSSLRTVSMASTSTTRTARETVGPPSTEG